MKPGLFAIATSSALLVASCHFASRPQEAPSELRFEYERGAMGTSFRLLFFASDRAAADSAADASFARIAELERELSDWSESSELSRTVAAATAAPGRLVATGPARFFLLAAGQEIARQSDGAFDVTVGPLVKLWRRARRQGELPKADALAAALAATGFGKLTLDPSTSSFALHSAGMALDLGGIAKGYAADQVLRLLEARGIPSALVAAGGDVGTSGPPPGETGWTVALAELAPDPADPVTPRFSVELAHASISTSGDESRYTEIGGVRYSHIVDPRTGIGLTERRLVSVIARDGTTADALATAVSVLGRERGLALVETTAGAATRFVEIEKSENGEARACTSPRWPPMMARPSNQDGENR